MSITYTPPEQKKRQIVYPGVFRLKDKVTTVLAMNETAALVLVAGCNCQVGEFCPDCTRFTDEKTWEYIGEANINVTVKN